MNAHSSLDLTVVSAELAASVKETEIACVWAQNNNWFRAKSSDIQ